MINTLLIRTFIISDIKSTLITFAIQTMIKRIISSLQQKDYDPNSDYKYWEINKALDEVISDDGIQRQFNRKISEKIYKLTPKQQFEKVKFIDYLNTLEAQQCIQYLQPESYIYSQPNEQEGQSQIQENVQPQQQEENVNVNQSLISSINQPLQITENLNQSKNYQSSIKVEELEEASLNEQSYSNYNNVSVSQMMNATIASQSSQIASQSNMLNERPGKQQQQEFRRKQIPTNQRALSSTIASQNNKLSSTLSTEGKSSLSKETNKYKMFKNSEQSIASQLISQDSIINPLLGSQQNKEQQNKFQNGIELQVQNGSNAEQASSKKKISKVWCIPFCFFIFGIMLVSSSFIIHALIKSAAIKQAILSPDNEGLWAHFPGDSQTDIYRNWTFFNITNADEMIFYNQRPKFRQIQGFKIFQREDYLDIAYIDDGDRVQMTDWLHFEQVPGSRSLDEKVKVLNVGGLGYWYNLKISRPTVLLQQGLALLFTTLQQSIIQNIFAQAISVQFLKEFNNAYSQIFSPAGLSLQEAIFIWNDPAYGMNNQNNLKYWIEAVSSDKDIENETINEQYIYLMNYFTLEKSQIDTILLKFSTYIEFITPSILKNYYCVDARQCTGRYLAYNQFANSFVTKNPPSGTPINATDSICQSNTTCADYYPEIQAFYEKVYLVRNPTKNASLKFQGTWMKDLVNYNISITEGKDYNTAENSLLHIGNLDALWDNGTLYEQSKQQYPEHSSDTHLSSIPNKYLQNIRKRFGLNSLPEAEVFWQWAKYLTNQLILRNQTNQKLGVGNLFAGGLYTGFSYLQDNLQDYLLIQLMYYDVKNSAKIGDCSNFVKDSFQLQQTTIPLQICNNYGQKISKKLIQDLLAVCKDPFKQSWKYFKHGFNISSVNLQSLCDSNQAENTFGRLLHNRRKNLNDLYHCDITPKQYCSDFELSAIQWVSSNVTLYPPKQLDIESNKHYTLKDWHKNASRFQYYFYKSWYSNNTDFPQLSVNDAYKLLNFDNWFSASVALKNFVDGKLSQKIKAYMRYVSIEVSLNGLTMERTPRQMIFGYNDQILEQAKKAYPPFGGDPSIPSLVAFNDPNVTKEEASLLLEWNTGKDNSMLVGQYRKINGLQYLTVEKNSFNGNITITQLISPWQGQDYFYGTSGKNFSPDQFDQSNISLYVPNIQRYGSGSIDDTYTQQRYGIQLQIGYLGEYIYESSSESDINKKYYQTFHGIFNQTSVVGVPLFVCKNHFMNVTENWTILVQIYNENGSIKYQNASEYDDSFVIVEPYSGVSFQSLIYLQTNYYHTPDSLLSFYQQSLLPVFSLWRSGNITEQAADKLFGPLRTALIVVKWIRIIGIVLVGATCITFGVVYYLKRIRNKKKQQGLNEFIVDEQNKSSQLGISLQPMTQQQQQAEQRNSKNEYVPPAVIVEQQQQED